MMHGQKNIKLRGFSSLFEGNLREAAFVLCMMEFGIL
jgi:hypothetical protein